MAELYTNPARATDSDNNPLSGAKLYFYVTGTTTPTDVYEGSDLVTPLSNPVEADSAGLFPAIYLDPAVTYRAVLKNSTGATTVYDNDPVSIGLGGATGASSVGKTGGGTVQDIIDTLTTNNLGTVATGTVLPLDTATNFTGDAGGATTLYAHRHIVSQQGANNTASVRVQYNGTEITGSGTCTLAETTHNYVWVKNSAAVTFARAVEAHIVSSSTGAIGDAVYFSAVSLTHTGTGVINNLKGFSCSDLGDTTKVNNASGFFCGNFTQPATFAAAFQSEMNTGTNKWGFYHTGTAPSAMAGSLALGFATAPAYRLHVFDTVTNWVGQITNAHATNPFGLRVQYTNAAPNTTDNDFIRCTDSSGEKFQVMSNGTIRVAATQVVSTRKTGWTAATGSATRTTFDTTTVTTQQLAERVKALLDDLISHGLIGS
jgi:hypothetical protein